MSSNVEEILQERKALLKTLEQRFAALAETAVAKGQVVNSLEGVSDQLKSLLSVEKTISATIGQEIAQQSEEFVDAGARLKESADSVQTEFQNSLQFIKSSMSELKDIFLKIETDVKGSVSGSVDRFSETLNEQLSAAHRNLVQEIGNATERVSESSVSMVSKVNSLFQKMEEEDKRFDDYLLEKRSELAGMFKVVDRSAKDLIASLGGLERAQTTLRSRIDEAAAALEKETDSIHETRGTYLAEAQAQEISKLVKSELEFQLKDLKTEVSEIKTVVGKKKFIF